MKNLSLIVFMMFFIGLANGQMAIKSISVFKNGTAFIQKSGNVKLQNGKFLWKEELPNAIYGTFWFASTNGKIQGISSSNDTLQVMREWVTFFDLLKANIGNEVEIATSEGWKKGVVLDAKGSANKGVILLKNGDEITLLKENNIKEVKLKSSMKTNYMVEEEWPTIELNFATKAKNAHLDVMYLSGGIRWTPMYKLLLTSDKEGVLNMRASVKNDGEDILNSNMNLVVGSPNMFTTSQITDLLDFGTQTIPLNTFKVSSMANKSSGFYEMDDAQNDTKNSTATSMEDLYLFNLKNITLKKGARAFYPLLETKVKVEHKYVCTLNNNVSVNNNYFTKYSASQIGGEVLHQLKMWNNSSNPFSSGTILINKNEKGNEVALATTVLDYTAMENCAYLTLSNAPDIEIKEEEIEVERTGKTKYWNKNKYIAIKVQSTVTIKSYKSKDVQMELKKLVYGTLENSDNPWKKTIFVNQYYVNGGTNVLWSFDLKAGEEKKIVYTYTVYIRG